MRRCDVVHGTDQDWEALGQLDPYWAVLTHDELRGSKLSEAEKVEVLLASGREHVARIWNVIEANLGGPFHPERVLDFGCGVGRIAIPLAERASAVVGVDVAESMLIKARTLCEQQNVSNVRFVRCDDALSGLDGRFDLVHSYIVLQHIPPSRGLRLLSHLIEKLNTDGVGVIHVLYHNPDLSSFPVWLLKSLWRRLKRSFRRIPQMQMNTYPLNDVCRIVQNAGIRQIHMVPTDHGGCLGVVLFFRRIAGAPYQLD